MFAGLDNVRRVCVASVNAVASVHCRLIVSVCLVRKNVVITAEHSDAPPPIIAISRRTNRKETEPLTGVKAVRVCVVICIEKRQNGRRRHTRELERKKAVRARIIVAFLPARVFPDRRTRR